MKIVSSLTDPAIDQPCVLSIGNFDGLHLGHRAILKTVTDRARQLGIQSAVLTFEPHPIAFLAPDKAPRRISTPRQKEQLIREAGIDVLFVAKFNAEFASLSPEDFIRNYIMDGLHARVVCVGSNFNFGRNQSGTIHTLRQWPTRFEIVETAAVMIRRTVASSTLIRKYVAAGRMTATR